MDNKDKYSPIPPNLNYYKTYGSIEHKISLEELSIYIQKKGDD